MSRRAYFILAAALLVLGSSSRSWAAPLFVELRRPVGLLVLRVDLVGDPPWAVVEVTSGAAYGSASVYSDAVTSAYRLQLADGAAWTADVLYRPGSVAWSVDSDGAQVGVMDRGAARALDLEERRSRAVVWLVALVGFLVFLRVFYRRVM